MDEDDPLSRCMCGCGQKPGNSAQRRLHCGTVVYLVPEHEDCLLDTLHDDVLAGGDRAEDAKYELFLLGWTARYLQRWPNESETSGLRTMYN